MGVLAELEKIWYFMKRDMVSFSTYKTNIAFLFLPQFSAHYLLLILGKAQSIKA